MPFGLSGLSLRVCLAAQMLMGTVVAIEPAVAADAPVLVVDGPVRTVFRWTSDRCEDEYLPDAPARAFRRADGQVVLMATHRENWTLTGPSLDSLTTSCKTVLSSADHKRAGGEGNLWIQALFTRDGKNVAALVSQDMTQETRRGGCPALSVPGQCWLNAILSAYSADEGRNFVLGAPVAELARRMPQGHEGRLGVFTVSNIVKGPDGYYMMTYMQGPGREQRGNCIFRSNDPMKPETWRAWNGTAFIVDLKDPGTGAQCKPVGAGRLLNEVRSLSWSTVHKTWIAVFTGRIKLDRDEVAVPGFYAATSPDLMNWSAPHRIMPAPTRAREQQNDYVVSYPSLMDPQSASRIFDTIDSNQPWLFFTWHHLSKGRGTLNRDLVAVPLRLQASN